MRAYQAAGNANDVVPVETSLQKGHRENGSKQQLCPTQHLHCIWRQQMPRLNTAAALGLTVPDILKL